MDLNLTPEERRAIKALQRVAKTWPKSLWLFSAAGTLTVMRKGRTGECVFSHNEGVDRDFVVDYVDIENDGGDW